MNPWDAATVGLSAPLAIVDVVAFEANAADLVHRARGLPIRVASKSVRCRALLRRVLDRPGFEGVMAYAVREAIWLVGQGDGGHFSDVFVAYPSVDVPALVQLRTDDRLARSITLTIDSREHVDFLAAVGGHHPLRVALDVDASLRVGRGRAAAHLGVRRSPVRTPMEARAVVNYARAKGLHVRGLMFYDAQIAGLPDSSPAVRLVKRRSAAELLERRREVVEAVGKVAELEFVNGGGTGSLHVTGADPAITELAAGSGLYGPTLFDDYRAFTPRHATAYAIPVVRRPAPGIVTAFSGGYIASGPPGWSRVPSVAWPGGLRLLRTEGAGEVQTPVRGAAADRLRLGDRIWLRHAKAGELFERFDEVHLVRGGELVETVPTYRGEGKNFG